MGQFAKRIVRSPVTGLLPWVPLTLVTTGEHLGWVVALSLALSAVFLITTVLVGDRVKNMELLDVCYFAVVGLILFFATGSDTQEIARWVAEGGVTVILVYSAGSLVVGRPFTSQYTLMDVAEGQGKTADFSRTNRTMSAIWVVVLAIQLASMVVSESILGRPDDPFLGWIVPVGSLIVGFVVGSRMTRGLVSRLNDVGHGS